ncbi:MAG: hypothetical protein ISS78_04620 [Phycisphaerae bacterium]|nr:hypothetical protein [Phycisphaerae bacterium]
MIVFAVAIASFVADRVLPGLGPEVPEGAEASVGMDIAAILPESAVAFSEESLSERPTTGRCKLADRLEEIAAKHRLELTDVKDAFRPGRSWIAQVPKKKAQLPAKTDQAKAERFVKNHRLQAVVVADRHSSAIINGRYLTIGQEMDGFKLVAVNKNSVVMVSQGARAVLRLAAGAADADR